MTLLSQCLVLAGSVLGTFAFAVEPNQSGPLQVVTASWLGGAGDEQIVGADVRDDQSLVLAVNAVDLKLGAAPVALGEAVAPAALAEGKKIGRAHV